MWLHPHFRGYFIAMTIKRNKRTEHHIIKFDRHLLVDLKKMQEVVPAKIYETINKGRKLKRRDKITLQFGDSGDDIVQNKYTCIIEVYRNNLPHFTKRAV